MPSEIIQWFPGHMAKTRRMIKENLKNVNVVIEILDARIPLSSRNPEIFKLTEGKPLLILLNKCDLADPLQTEKWVKHYTSDNSFCLPIDCISGSGINKIMPAIETLMSDKIKSYESKGMSGRKLKAMVLGIPNVGKSSLINKLSGTKKTKVENRPGVTLDKQWVPAKENLMLLDMPGVLWPKFDDKIVGENLASTGAIKDTILDIENVAAVLCRRLRENYRDLLYSRYKILDTDDADDLSDYELLLLIGKKRGFLISGGEINVERTANMLLDEFRSSKIGKITLDIIK